jgi:diguanylate cyclase (GGDEF)-like protein
VLCLDLDRFKEVNDLFGHAAGDKMLQSVANRITSILDESQMMARLSGDEFAIIAPGLSNPAAAGRIAENILEVLQCGTDTPDADPRVSTSIGIALCPMDATDRNALLSHADTALYRAKNEGRGTYRFFEAAMGVAVRDRRLLEHDLRNAIPRGEMRLVYQPQKDIRTGTVFGFEALLRWTHPTRGEVSPAEFIPIAEDTGVILSIGEWVLRKACAEATRWGSPLTIAVNVSAVQIHNANFAHVVHQVLFDTGLAPGRLELEITETALVRDLNRALATLRHIKMLGVRIVMDDFGTGYSSLSNLRAFPFDKIIRSTARSSNRSITTSRPPPSCVPCWGSAAPSICRCLRRAWRRLPNSISSQASSATRRKAIFSASRATSSNSVGRRKASMKPQKRQKRHSRPCPRHRACDARRLLIQRPISWSMFR